MNGALRVCSSVRHSPHYTRANVSVISIEEHIHKPARILNMGETVCVSRDCLWTQVVWFVLRSHGFKNCSKKCYEAPKNIIHYDSVTLTIETGVA